MDILNNKKQSNSFSIRITLLFVVTWFLTFSCDTSKESLSKPDIVRKKIPISATSSQTAEKKRVQFVQKANAATQSQPPQVALLPIQGAMGAKKPNQTSPQKTLKAALSVPVRQEIRLEAPPPLYNPKGKTDPFRPLIKDPRQTVKKKNIRKRIPRTPLERMDISQIKLVAIIRSDSDNLALLEEASGKGYIISAGAYVGLNGGRVTKILKDRLIVEEEAENAMGKISMQKRELKLQKPAGEM